MEIKRVRTVNGSGNRSGQIYIRLPAEILRAFHLTWKFSARNGEDDETVELRENSSAEILGRPGFLVDP
jgi:hypothetical protein